MESRWSARVLRNIHCEKCSSGKWARGDVYAQT